MHIWRVDLEAAEVKEEAVDDKSEVTPKEQSSDTAEIKEESTEEVKPKEKGTTAYLILSE